MKNLAFCALLASGNALAAPVLVPNGDFALGMTSWFEVSGGGSYAFSYPETGGNPDGYGVIDNTGGGGFGIWVANGGDTIPLVDLGLTAGQTYTFMQDMITLVDGAGHTGGVKIESWAGGVSIGDSGDRFATSESASWATYSFAYTIVPGADSIKVVPLWGEGASIGYDNIRVENVPVTTPPPSAIIPNGDFEEAPPGTKWAFFQDAGHTVNYPTTGGNPGGHAVINSVGIDGGFAVMVSNGGGTLPLSGLGLTAGQTYTFTQDMKILAGPNVGGVKIEYPPMGDSGDLRPTIIGDGSTWETYSFVVTIPAGATGLKIVPLWGISSQVAFDNFKIVLPAPVSGSTIRYGTVVSWNATSGSNTYQPQESADNSIWANLGPALTGNTVTSVFDAVKSPFYRVLETAPGPVTTVIPATSAPGVEISFPTATGNNYQVESSLALSGWTNFGPVIAGDGSVKTITDINSTAKKFYRVGITTP